MKHFFSSFLMMLSSLGLFAGQVSYTYHFDQPVIGTVGEYQSVSFANTYLTGTTGRPALPYMGVNLLLPPGEEATNVVYEFEEEVMLDGTYTLYLQQPSRPVSAGAEGIFYKDESVYKQAIPYPAVAWGQFSTHFMNGHSFLLASFTPVNYIPATGSVSFYKKVIIRIETAMTDRSTRALEHLNTNVQARSRVQALAQNPDMMQAYPADRSRDDGYQVLIITPQTFQATFEPLLNLYLVRGFQSEIITTEYIAANINGQDLQEKMRNYILQEYQQNGIEYVVLGGDDEYIPHRGFYCYVVSGGGYEDSDIPSDLYYSALDGNWNTDGDGYWGEIGEDDLLPDVAVARYPVSTVSQLQKMIHKTTLYQDQPVTGELQRPVMAGENLYNDPLTYGEDYLELLIGAHSDNGYTTYGIPESYNFQKLYDHLEYWDGNELIQAINMGTPFVHHSGHADQSYVMRMYIDQINNGTFSGANGTDHNYTLVYTHGCLCGAFDENDCIGEAMVLIDNFAVAVVMNSRYGWFNEGQTEGPSAHLHREFVDALYNDKENHIGMAHLVSKVATSTWVNAPGQWEEGALRWCFYCCNVLGDPVLGIWTAEPIDIVTNYPGEVLPETISVPVTVMSNGQPLTGTSCVVMGDGEMLGCAQTDEAGQAVVSVPAGFAGISSAELVVSGYNCLPHHYPLAIQVGVSEMPSGSMQVFSKPNPFRDKTSLCVFITQSEEIRVNFYLLTGQLLGSVTQPAHSGLNEIRPDTSNWPEGIIIAEIKAGHHTLHHQMIHLNK